MTREKYVARISTDLAIIVKLKEKQKQTKKTNYVHCFKMPVCWNKDNCFWFCLMLNVKQKPF